MNAMQWAYEMLEAAPNKTKVVEDFVRAKISKGRGKGAKRLIEPRFKSLFLSTLASKQCRSALKSITDHKMPEENRVRSSGIAQPEWDWGDFDTGFKFGVVSTVVILLLL